MSDTTPAAKKAASPVIAPDLSEKTVDNAVTQIATAANPFIPAKVRAGIYAVGGLVVVVAAAVSPVIGGTVGTVLDGISAGVGALVAATAASHIQ